jgi:uncharacterized protein YegP (UPF0339 family)
MDRWEFFQDTRGLWRWRCTSADGQVMLCSNEAYQSRVHVIANASAHGYVEGAEELEREGTFVNLKALPEDAAATDVRGTQQSEPLRRTGYNPYDTTPGNPRSGRKP